MSDDAIGDLLFFASVEVESLGDLVDLCFTARLLVILIEDGDNVTLLLTAGVLVVGAKWARE